MSIVPSPDCSASSRGRFRLFISRLDGRYEAAIREGLEYVGLVSRLRPGDRVFVKPNLTYPTYRPGVMTSPEAVEALIRVLGDHAVRITVGEADSGGYNPFSMSEVFRATGLEEMARRYGVDLVNLTHAPSRPLRIRSGLRRLEVPLPVRVLDDTDWFVSMPVPKVHMNTGVSLTLKNQWGLIQVPAARLRLHPYFSDVVYEINRALPPSVSVVDGRFGLTRSGPLRGDPLELDWLMVADNLFAADYACCHLMGIPTSSVPYLSEALDREGIQRLAQLEWSQESAPFCSTGFYLKRAWTDLPGLFAFKSRIAAYVGYESPLAGLLHKILYLFREPFY